LPALRHCGLDPQSPSEGVSRHCGLDPQSPDREPFIKRGVGVSDGVFAVIALLVEKGWREATGYLSPVILRERAESLYAVFLFVVVVVVAIVYPNDNNKNVKDKYQKQRPLTLPSPARGEGTTTATANRNTALRDSALTLCYTQNDRQRQRHLSSWIATGRQRAPRNEDHCLDYDTSTAKWKTTKAYSETATPHPALSRKGRGKDNARQR
jgi:hypothetical protein